MLIGKTEIEIDLKIQILALKKKIFGKKSKLFPKICPKSKIGPKL